MLVRVGLVIAQRDCVVKRQFDLKKYGQIEFTIVGEQVIEKPVVHFLNRVNQPGFQKYREMELMSHAFMIMNIFSGKNWYLK